MTCEACGGKCCKADWEIVFDDTEPVPKRLSKSGSRMIGGCLEGERMMRKNADGHCMALRDGKCSIYDRRPTVCREFDVGSPECILLMEVGR